MNVFAEKRRVVVTCYKRLSGYLEKEMETLGFKPERVFSTGVELQATGADCIRLNLNLFCAAHVLYSLLSFRAKDAEDLYQKISAFPWEELLSNEKRLSVTSKVFNDSIDTPLFANVKVKDAIVDRMRKQTGKRPDTGPDLSGVVIHLHWMDDKAELFLDTSGETISKHGYRKIPGKAPMLESLAAATVMATDWDCQSSFINPMCGSGTIAIEAALKATGRKPGLFRDNYSFMHVSHYDPQAMERERAIIQSHQANTFEGKIIATDIDPEIIKKAKTNAKAAGVEEFIIFQCCDFADTQVPEDNPGVVFFNPEYGERLGDEDVLVGTYRRIGDFLKQKCKGYKGFIFTGNLNLAKQVGLKASRRLEFYSGTIDCRLLQYELYSGTRREPLSADNKSS